MKRNTPVSITHKFVLRALSIVSCPEEPCESENICIISDRTTIIIPPVPKTRAPVGINDLASGRAVGLGGADILNRLIVFYAVGLVAFAALRTLASLEEAEEAEAGADGAVFQLYNAIMPPMSNRAAFTANVA